MSFNDTILAADVTPLAGPVLLGSLLNWGLFGVLSLQVYLYHIAFPNDSVRCKILVYVIYLLDAAQTFIVTGDVFEIYARRYGDVNELNLMHNEWLAVPVFCSIVSAIVQIYYAWRIRVLSRSWYLMALVILLALMQSILGLVTGVQAKIIGNFRGLEEKAHLITIVWLAGSAACDVLIAVIMSYLLLRKAAQLAQGSTRTGVNRIVQLIVETGTLTALAALLSLALFAAFPQRAYYSCIGAVFAKLYANSLLVIFNSRIQINGQRDSQDPSRGVSHDSPVIQVGVARLDGIQVQEQIFVHTDDTDIEMNGGVLPEAKRNYDGVW